MISVDISGSISALWRATKAQWIGHMMLKQLPVTLLLFGDQGGGTRNGFKTCVLSEWYTTLCALRFALPIKFKHTVATTNYLTVSLKEHGNDLSMESYLFLIFCRFHVNNDDITIVMWHALERGWSIYSHGSVTGPDVRLVPIGYFKT